VLVRACEIVINFGKELKDNFARCRSRLTVWITVALREAFSCGIVNKLVLMACQFATGFDYLKLIMLWSHVYAAFKWIVVVYQLIGIYGLFVHHYNPRVYGICEG